MKLASALNITPQKLFVDLRPKLRLQPHLGLQTSPLLQELMPLEILSPLIMYFQESIGVVLCWMGHLPGPVVLCLTRVGPTQQSLRNT